MARRRRKKEDPVEALLGMATLGGAIFAYYLTKSVTVTVIVVGVIIGLYIAIVMLVNQKRVERLKRSGIADIDKMDGRKFELYLGHLFKAHGYTVEVTKAAGDFGADLVITKGGKRIVVQAKRYSKNVGIKAVQEAQAAIAHYKASEAWAVTNRDYTEAAYALAKSNGVRMINRERLIEMILVLNPGTSMPTAKQIIEQPDVEEQHEQDDDLECSRCGFLMVKRKGSRGEFYGCSNFPICRHTQAI